MNPNHKTCLGFWLLVTTLLIVTTTLFQGENSVNAAVTLSYFIAIPGDSVITLEWETATEFNNAGFYVTRSLTQDGLFERISDFIPAEGLGIQGAQYQYSDTNVTNGTTYYYILEAIDTSQFIEYYGPISSTAGIPTPTNTFQPSKTPTQTRTPIPPTNTLTNTINPSSTITPSTTPTPGTTTQPVQTSPTSTQTKKSTNTPTATSTHTKTQQPTQTQTRTPKPAITDTLTPTANPSPEASATQTITPTETYIPLPIELLVKNATSTSTDSASIPDNELPSPTQVIPNNSRFNQPLPIWVIVIIVIGVWVIIASLIYLRFFHNRE